MARQAKRYLSEPGGKSEQNIQLSTDLVASKETTCCYDLRNTNDSSSPFQLKTCQVELFDTEAY